MPVCDLPDGLSEGVDDDRGSAVAEALDGEIVGLIWIFSWIPKPDNDAVLGKVRADALTDGAGLGESEGRHGRDEDDGVGFVGERFEDLAGDGGRESEGLVEPCSRSCTSICVVSSSA